MKTGELERVVESTQPSLLDNILHNQREWRKYCDNSSSWFVPIALDCM